MKLFRLVPLIFIVSFFCDRNSSQPDNSEIFAHISSLIYQDYSALEIAANTLTSQIAAYQASPSLATLAMVRNSYIEARRRLKIVEIYQFGPAVESSLYVELDSWAKGLPLCAAVADCTITIESIV